MLKVKKGDLFEANHVITRKVWLADFKELPSQENALQLADVLYKLMDEINDLTDKRKALLNEFGKKNKYKQLIIEKVIDQTTGGETQKYALIDPEAFQKGIDALFAEEIETEGIEYEWLKNMPLCPAEIRAIRFLFKS